jgi:glycosyltransferase involved in cell wall biosynthesis
MQPTTNDRQSVARTATARPLVSIVLPAFNEEAILEENFGELQKYLTTLESRYRFEILIVNDGSRDRTPAIADALAQRQINVRVFHHPRNFGLGQAFNTAFRQTRGAYVITMDIDLSYSPEHVGALLEEITRSHAKLVLASPYMKGGRISHVPWLRRTLSIWANRFLSLFAHGNLSTLTCMVRAYDGPYVRSLIHRSTGMDIMPETVYKSMIMRAGIRQIPAHLDWSRQVAVGVKRTSSMRILRQIFATLISGFVFRPFMFFVLPGLLLLVFSLWVNFWMVMHFLEAFADLAGAEVPDRVSAAVALAYQQYPHTFIVGLLSLALAIQLVSLGILALQSKNYFEELFYAISRAQRPLDVTVKPKDEGELER